MRVLLGVTLMASWVAGAQGTAPGARLPVVVDARVGVAEAWIGRALFLRGEYVADELSFDASGRAQGGPKRGEWTLSGFDLKKVTLRPSGEVLLEGVRVLIRYNVDAHQFERRPQNEEAVKIRVADAATPQRLDAALEGIFAQGIDPRLQRETPVYWQHFFNPGLAWPADALSKETVVEGNGPAQGGAEALIAPVPVHKVGAKFTPSALRDKLRGTIQMRLVVDAAGVPRRIALVRPLGYGLDERAVEALAEWRFTPAMWGGKPVAVSMLVNFEFED